MFKPIFLLYVFVIAAASARNQSPVPAVTGKNIFKKPYAVAPVNPNANISPSMLVAPSFYAGHLPFFCREEIKIEHAVKIPFKFRLGSVQYVDYLEGKKGAAFPAP